MEGSGEVRKGDRERGRENESESPTYKFTPQMVLMSRADPSQKPVALSGSPQWASGTQTVGPYSIAFPRPLAGSWTGSAAIGLTGFGPHTACQNYRW